jgi:acetyl esterase/lipase
MAWINRIVAALVVVSTMVELPRAEEPPAKRVKEPTPQPQSPKPAKPGTKVELRWAEFKPIQGVTDNNPIPFGEEGTSPTFLHKQPVLTIEDIAEARVGKGSDWEINGKTKQIHSVTLHFTKEGQQKLVKSGEPGKSKLLALLINGSNTSTSYLDVADIAKYVQDVGIYEKPDAEGIAAGINAAIAAARQGDQADKPLIKTTHVYKTVGDVKVEADVYRPEGAEARPVVVWIHGGALIVGSRSQVPKQILELCTRERFVFVSLDYRLAPEVKLPEIAADVQDAFRWLREQGPKLFGADTRRIVVTGGSAGGFLTMLSGVLCSPKPTALVAYWGYGDIDGEWTRSKSTNHGVPVPREEALAAVNKNGKVLTNTDDPAEGKARGGYYRHLRQTGGWSMGVTGIDVEKEPGKLDRFCPVKQITRDYPPILMIHGTKDTDVPYFCSTDMARELTKHGVKHELLTLEGAEHGLRDGDPKRVAEANARALEFIKEQLVK